MTLSNVLGCLTLQSLVIIIMLDLVHLCILSIGDGV